jgi:hypothetical protein
MRHAQEIFDRVSVDARETDEDARVLFVVRGGVVDVRLFCDERVTVAANLRPSTSSVGDRQAVPAVVFGSISPISRTIAQVISFTLAS